MIIIKTKTGQTLVNDKEIISVQHNREAHTAYVSKPTSGTLWRHQPPIEQVESVNYINDQTGTEWKDSGSEIEYLRREMESLKMELQCQTEINKRTKERLRHLGHECVQWVQYYHEDMPDKLCEQMRNRGEEEKAYVNDNEDWIYRREWFQNHQKPEEIEADEVARLNTTIEAQAAEIRNLKDQIKRMEANERMRKEFQPEENHKGKKSWWHRIMSWFD